VVVLREGEGVAKALRNNDRDAAVKLLRSAKAVETDVVAEALAYYEQGADSFSEMVEKEMHDRRGEVESGLLFLGTLGNNAPFIGLFGTVLGIVHSFRELGAANPAAGGSGNMDNVMNGIAEALISTAVGILVAIPAVVAYNVFSKRAQNIEANASALQNVVLAHLKSDGNGGAARTTATAEESGPVTSKLGLGRAHLGSVVEEQGEA
jgi:biopolymer transport protein ExbB/TolQ